MEQKKGDFTINIEGVTEVTGQLPHPYTAVGTAAKAQFSIQIDSNTQHRTTEATRYIHNIIITY